MDPDTGGKVGRDMFSCRGTGALVTRGEGLKVDVNVVANATCPSRLRSPRAEAYDDDSGVASVPILPVVLHPDQSLATEIGFDKFALRVFILFEQHLVATRPQFPPTHLT